MTAAGTSRLTAALADRYRIERELGQGGMATVYLARDLKHDRDVALKVVREEISTGLGSERFLREIRLAASLHHPHILPLYDSGEADGCLYYVMPVAEGESLRERLAREQRLPVGDAVRLAREVADALDYAHRHEVVHRDIKPENILLHEGHALITDFGIGKALSTAAPGDALTQIGLAVGTPAYMSPEQAGGEANLDGRSDLYSLGCVLYEMIAGTPPFTGPTVQSVIAKRFTDPPPDLSAIHPSVPAPVAAVARKLMATEPADRFATGARAATALASSTAPDGTGVAAEAGETPAHSESKTRSIAVLPFVNQSPDPENEYFSDGISEEIISALAQLPGLRVAARTSAFSFKGRNEDLRVIGEKLGVTTVLEGSVRRAGSKLRITAQLIDAADGYHLWSERYDRDASDVFAIQDEIAAAIASKLKLTFEVGESRPVVRPPTANLDAYGLLLKGRVLHAQRGASILKAREAFEQALLLDPELAEAHALLGDAYRLLAVYGMTPTAEVIPRARAAVKRALALDPRQVEALATLASITAIFDWDAAGSNAWSDRAVAIDPSHVRSIVERAFINTYRRDTTPAIQQESARQFAAAIRLDPLSAWAAAIHSFGLSSLGRHHDAVAEARRAIEVDPAAFTGRWALVWALGAGGRDAEALEAAEPALQMSGRGPRILAEAAAAHARLEARDAAEQIYQEIRSRARTGYVGWSEQGAIAAAAGRMQEAREFLARGIEARDSYLAFQISPAWGPFRADPAGRAMLETVGP
jgi:serine/threonine-protein kinase